MKLNPQQIGCISNNYGNLSIASKDGKYYWSIEDWDGDHWEEIPEYLYKTLVRYEKARKRALKKEEQDI